jgi:DNA-binding transcriptional ArsR family regulator
MISLKAVSEEIRVRILLLLVDREACVCELMEVFGMPQSKLSHHLIILRNAGLLQDERRGKWNYYRLNTHALSPMNRQLVDSLGKWFAEASSLESDRRKLQQACCRTDVCK